MQARLHAARQALKLGLVLGAFSTLAAFGQLADANVSSSAELHARMKPLAAKLDGDWSDAGLARALGVPTTAGVLRTPGVTGTVDFAPNPLLAGDRPEMRFADLPYDKARTINAGVPFSEAPVVAAKPFVLTGAADDKARALTCMTQAVYYEAGFEPIDGERAVAQVVLNRMRHPIFPHSVCGVVYQGSAQTTGCQFSFTCDGALNRGQPGAVAWARARQVAQEALNGYVQSAIGLATHYHTDYVAPYWMTSVTKITKVGQHIFYRWPGTLGQPGAFFAKYTAVERIAATPNPSVTELTKATGGLVIASTSDAATGRIHAQLAAAGLTAPGVTAETDAAASGATPMARRAAMLAGHGGGQLPADLTTVAPPAASASKVETVTLSAPTPGA